MQNRVDIKKCTDHETLLLPLFPPQPRWHGACPAEQGRMAEDAYRLGHHDSHHRPKAATNVLSIP